MWKLRSCIKHRHELCLTALNFHLKFLLKDYIFEEYNYVILLCGNTSEKKGNQKLVSPDVFPLHIIDKRPVNDAVAARGRIVACEIPVTGIRRTCLMKGFDRLVNHLDWCFDIGRSN